MNTFVQLIQRVLAKLFPYKGYNPYDMFVVPARRARSWDDLKQLEK